MRKKEYENEQYNFKIILLEFNRFRSKEQHKSMK